MENKRCGAAPSTSEVSAAAATNSCVATCLQCRSFDRHATERQKPVKVMCHEYPCDQPSAPLASSRLAMRIDVRAPPGHSALRTWAVYIRSSAEARLDREAKRPTGEVGREGGVDQLVHLRDVGRVGSFVGHRYGQLPPGCFSPVLNEHPERIGRLPVRDHDEPQ